MRDYLYFACHVDGELVGCLALVPQSSAEVRMRQVAVKPRLQGQGIGRALVEYAEQSARERGFSVMMLHARDTAIPFYEKLGYERVGEPFMEVTILHCEMQKKLSDRLPNEIS
jgi:N-acetylglutamate synthase-like GNAT family acetyltransferase